MKPSRTVAAVTAAVSVLCIAAGVIAYVSMPPHTAPGKADTSSHAQTNATKSSSANTTTASFGKKRSLPTANAVSNATASGATRQLQRNQLHGTIVSLGDSITFGFNLPGATATTPSPDAYPFWLGRMIHAHVVDLGVPRWTTDNVIKALGTEKYQTALRKATLVTVDIGSNDLLHSFNGLLSYYLEGKQPPSLQPTINDLNHSINILPGQLTTIVNKIRALTKAPIILTTIYDPAPDNTVLHDFTDPFIVEANDVIMRVAALKHTYLYDAYDTINHNQWSLIRLEDIDIHPTVAGQRALASGFDDVLNNKAWNTPTLYAVSTNGAKVYESPSTKSHILGQIKGTDGYRITGHGSDFDTISYRGHTGYVKVSDITEILRLSDQVVFGQQSIEVTPVTWQTTEGAQVNGFIYKNRVYAPAVALAKLLGRGVHWDNTARIVDIAGGDLTQMNPEKHPSLSPTHANVTSITVSFNGSAVKIGGELVHLDAEPFSYQGTVYAPVSALWPQLGGQPGGLTGGLLH